MGMSFSLWHFYITFSALLALFKTKHTGPSSTGSAYTAPIFGMLGRAQSSKSKFSHPNKFNLSSSNTWSTLPECKQNNKTNLHFKQLKLKNISLNYYITLVEQTG